MEIPLQALSVHELAAAGAGPVDMDLAAGAYGCLLAGPGDGGSALLRSVSRGRRDTILVAARNPPRLAWGRVADRIARARAARGPQSAAARAAVALAEELGLDPSRRLATLDASGWRRLRLCGALAARPAWLLLDDPMAGEAEAPALSRTLREACRHAAVGVLHATSRRDEAFGVADVVFVLGRGRILQHGTPASLYERPASLEIALRAGPGTVLAGTVAAVDDECATVQLTDGPAVMAAAPAGADVVGRACHLLLRPERMAISPLAAADLGSGAIAGVLRSSAHLGDRIRLAIAIGTDLEVIVSRPSALGDRGLVAGRQVSLAWQIHHALTFLDPIFPGQGG